MYLAERSRQFSSKPVKKYYRVAIEKVDYEFQKGGNEILRIITKKFY
jgi:hypothetical protein